MSVPLARRILYNWKEYQQVYNPEQMVNLRKLLQKQDALTTQEANKYFKILETQRKKEKGHKKGGKFQRVCHKSSKAKKDIDKVVNAVMKFFIKKPSCQVKDRHYVITNAIIQNVIDKKIAQHLKRSNKDLYSMTLYQVIDQISVWIDQKVDEIDTVDLDGDFSEDLSVSTSVSDSDATVPDELISNEELRLLLEQGRICSDSCICGVEEESGFSGTEESEGEEEEGEQPSTASERKRSSASTRPIRVSIKT